MSEWYDCFAEDKTETPVSNISYLHGNSQTVQEKELQGEPRTEQRVHLLDALLARLDKRFPLLVTQFKRDIEHMETPDLIRRLSITLALARNEAAARRAILVATRSSLGECTETGCTDFLPEEFLSHY